MYAPLGIVVAITILVVLAENDKIDTFYNDLYRDLVIVKPNWMVSPFNAHVILSLLYQGSGGDTTSTLQDKLQVLNKFVNARIHRKIMAELESSTDVSVHLANKLCVKNRYLLKESYVQIARFYFATEVENVNFLRPKKVARDVNKWIKRKTHGRIERILESDEVDETTRGVILNAVTFKARWKTPFLVDDTTEQTFYASDYRNVTVDMMMTQQHFFYAEHLTLDAKLLKIPYKNKHFNMVIVLPNSKTGIWQLEKRIIFEDLATVLNESRMQKQLVRLWLPKFKFQSTVDLRDALTKVGFGEIFSYFAKFTNMITTDESLMFDRFIQKSLVEVTEFGSEASSGGAAQQGRHSLKPGRVQFRVDHPFIFYITADIKSINVHDSVLFMGRVFNPTSIDAHEYLI